MKLSCTQENLSRGLGLVSRTISTRSALPILTNILLKTDKGRLKLSATDLEIGINSWIGAKVEEEGKVAVPGRLISDFVNINNDNKILLQSKDHSLTLKSEKYQAQIKGSNPDDFPLIPQIKKQSTLELESSKFQKGIEEVVGSCALDESRPVLAGVLLKIKPNQIKLVATDSYRLAEKKINLTSANNEEKNIIIPAKTMQEINRIILSLQPKTIQLTFSENQVQFNLDNSIEIISRLIEGKFPDYEQIIPNSFQTRAQVVVGEFKNAIQMSSLFAKEAANNIKIIFDPEGTMTLMAQTAQIGQNISKIAAKISGNRTEISFNAKFLLEALSVISTNEAAFEISDKFNNPGVIKPKDSKDYIHIIMPLRTEE